MQPEALLTTIPPDSARPVSIVLPGIPGALDQAAFITLFGPIFEHSPWVAASAWECRPFADLPAVHQTMVGAVRAGSREAQLTLLRAHPELWGREARARQMTADSLTEQAGAGLLSLDAGAAARIDALNAAHQQKFGFPFIIAAMKNSRDQILSEFERRLDLDADAEFNACLEQVFLITGLRVERLVGCAGGPP